MQLHDEGWFALEWGGPVNQAGLGAQPGDRQVRFAPGPHADAGYARQVQVFRHAISVGSGFDQTERMARPRGGLAGTHRNLWRSYPGKCDDGIDSKVGAQHLWTTFRANYEESLQR